MASKVIGPRAVGKVELFVQTRDDARNRGDIGVFRAMCAELDRLGYTEPAAIETAAVIMPERAVPAGKRSRTVA